jgi:hypothetical protein
VPDICSRGKDGIPAGVEHAKLRACLEVQPAHSNGDRRDVSGSGAVDVTCQAATLASELVAVAANSGVARRAAAFGDVGARRRRNGQAGKREKEKEKEN